MPFVMTQKVHKHCIFMAVGKGLAQSPFVLSAYYNVTADY